MDILVGFDGSNSSEEALRIAQKYTIASKGNLIVVTVVVRHSKGQSEEIGKVETSLKSIQNDCNKKKLHARRNQSSVSWKPERLWLSLPAKMMLMNWSSVLEKGQGSKSFCSVRMHNTSF